MGRLFRSALCLLHLSLFASAAIPANGFASEHANPLFGYPHILQSPFTMNAGSLFVGSQIALGVTDFFQVGTDLVRVLNDVINANAKLSLLDTEAFAMAFVAGYETYNYRSYAPSNPDIRIHSFQPGLVMAYQMADPSFACFNGLTFNVSEVRLQSEGIEKSGYIKGTQVGMDCAWEYNPPAKARVGNVLAAGVNYDFNYGIYGLGLSHHWPGFQLGIHYYPLAQKYRILPIVGVGLGVAF